MKVYYQNALKTASLSVTNLVSGEVQSDLIQQDLERTVNCSANSSVITATWTAEAARAADALFISNTNALLGTLKLYNQSGALTRALAIGLGKWNNKITFPSQAVGKIELTLQSPVGTKLYAGMVFLALGLTLPRFVVGVDMSDETRGTGGRSDGGQSWGMDGVNLETIALSWKRVTNEERRIFRRYINDVQLHLNHYISPYDGIDMYVTITGAGTWTKHDGNGFYWDTNIKYEEAR
jgi:hypothetical protein